MVVQNNCIQSIHYLHTHFTAIYNYKGYIFQYFNSLFYIFSYDLKCIKGIEFGEETVKSWLVSFLVSIIASIFLTQPLQVWIQKKTDLRPFSI